MFLKLKMWHKNQFKIFNSRFHSLYLNNQFHKVIFKQYHLLAIRVVISPTKCRINQIHFSKLSNNKNKLGFLIKYKTKTHFLQIRITSLTPTKRCKIQEIRFSQAFNQQIPIYLGKRKIQIQMQIISFKIQVIN